MHGFICVVLLGALMYAEFVFGSGSYSTRISFSYHARHLQEDHSAIRCVGILITNITFI